MKNHRAHSLKTKYVGFKRGLPDNKNYGDDERDDGERVLGTKHAMVVK